MLAEHEASHAAAQPPAPPPGPTTTLSEQLRTWLNLEARLRDLEAARQQATAKAADLGHEHDALEGLLHQDAPAAASAPDATTSPSGAGEEPSATLARLQRLSDQRKTLGDLDKRIQDAQQLADVYRRWGAAAAAQVRGVLHLLLISLVGILTILLALVVTERAIRYAFSRQKDRRRVHQLRVIATIALQAIGALVILFIVFGLPNQTSTMIGLATAGLTVVLRDFIVAFFGWFALIGKNGMRVGDWVEIEGVGGEVVEIGILKTVLLEMGDWTNTGHPTGRRVSFNNKFAIENHYFNFSTEGQWLWDELRMTLPNTSSAYQMVSGIRETVAKQTEADARLAEQDWERATNQYGARPFSATPSVDLRPSAGGLEVIVRYIVRAPQRYEVKSRLFEAVVALVHRGQPEGVTRS